MRAPFQILVIPFVKESNKYLFAIFQRSDLGIWQFIVGGGEDDEKPIDAAKRETFEEAGISKSAKFNRLSSLTTIPAENIHGMIWGKETIMIPEIAYGVELKSKELVLSNEHTKYEWVNKDEAIHRLKYDSNKSAVWELNQRLNTNTISEIRKNIDAIKGIFLG